MNRLGTFMLLCTIAASGCFIERIANKVPLNIEMDVVSDLNPCIDCVCQEQEIEYAVTQIELSLQELQWQPMGVGKHEFKEEAESQTQIEAKQLDIILEKAKKLYLLKKLILQKPKDNHDPIEIPYVATAPYLVPLTVDAQIEENKMEKLPNGISTIKSHQKYVLELKLKQYKIIKKLRLVTLS